MRNAFVEFVQYNQTLAVSSAASVNCESRYPKATGRVQRGALIDILKRVELFNRDTVIIRRTEKRKSSRMKNFIFFGIVRLQKRGGYDKL